MTRDCLNGHSGYRSAKTARNCPPPPVPLGYRGVRGGEGRGGGYRREGLRSTHKAVHTQGSAHTRRSVATAGVLLFKGGCGGWPPRRAKRAVCQAQQAEGYGAEGYKEWGYRGDGVAGGGGYGADYLTVIQDRVVAATNHSKLKKGTFFVESVPLQHLPTTRDAVILWCMPRCVYRAGHFGGGYIFLCPSKNLVF